MAGMAVRRARWILLALLLTFSPDPVWFASGSLVTNAFHDAAGAWRGGNGRGDRAGRSRGDRKGRHGHWGGDKNGDDDGAWGDAGDDGSDSDSGKPGKSGWGNKGGEDSDSDTGDLNGDSGEQPGKSDKSNKNDKNDKNDKKDKNDDTENSEIPTKDKSVADKDKSSKKDKKAAKPAVVATPTDPEGGEGGSSRSEGDHRAGEVVGVGMSSADIATVSAMGFTVATPAVLAAGELPQVVELLVPANVDEDEARAALAKALPGRHFGLNKVYSGYSTATASKTKSAKSSDGEAGADPRCSGDRCYGRVMIGWQTELESCQAGASIGMIDTGIDVDHPAFAGRSMVVKSFAPRDVEEESHAHATGVAALIVGSGRESTPGLLPKARLVAADVFYVDDKKNVVTDTASLLRALRWLDEAGVGIINMSFSGPQDGLVADEIARLSAKGVVFVAAAGNNGPGAPDAYPAAYAPVVAVTAVDSRMKSYIKANHGSYIDVAAPGVKIWTATANGKSGYQSGTSFAVPFVTAALAAAEAFGTPGSADAWLDSAGIDEIGEPEESTIFGRGLLKAPVSCGGSSLGGDILSALLSGPVDATQRVVRSSLGMTQR
jgi:hypothetical protein